MQGGRPGSGARCAMLSVRRGSCSVPPHPPFSIFLTPRICSRCYPTGVGVEGETEPYTLHPIPYTLHHTPYTLQPTLCTLHPTPYTLHPTPYTLHPAPCTLHPSPYTLNTKHHATPYIVHPQPQFLTPLTPPHHRSKSFLPVF